MCVISKQVAMIYGSSVGGEARLNAELHSPRISLAPPTLVRRASADPSPQTFLPRPETNLLITCLKHQPKKIPCKRDCAVSSRLRDDNAAAKQVAAPVKKLER